MKDNKWLWIIVGLILLFLILKPKLDFLGATTYPTGIKYIETNYGDSKIDWDNVYYISFTYSGCIPESCIDNPYVMINNQKYNVQLSTCESYEFGGTSPTTQKYEIELDKSFFKNGIYQFSYSVGCTNANLPEEKNNLKVRFEVMCKPETASTDCKDPIRGTTTGDCLINEKGIYRCTNYPDFDIENKVCCKLNPVVLNPTPSYKFTSKEYCEEKVIGVGRLVVDNSFCEPTTNKFNYLPYLMGGSIIVLLIFFIFRKK